MSTGAKRMGKLSKQGTKARGTRSTFTYYIPAPPHRKSGYREKEFDKILTGIMASGFEIEDLQIQSVSSDNGAGLFVVAILRAPNKKVFAQDEAQDIQERFRLSETHSSPDIILEDEEFSDDF